MIKVSTVVVTTNQCQNCNKEIVVMNLSVVTGNNIKIIIKYYQNSDNNES